MKLYHDVYGNNEEREERLGLRREKCQADQIEENVNNKLSSKKKELLNTTGNTAIHMAPLILLFINDPS